MSDEIPDPFARLQETVDAGFSRMDANYAFLSGDIGTLKSRMATTESRLSELDDRASKGSLRAKAITDGDLSQDAAIASIKVRVETIEAKTDAQTLILTQLSRVASNPLVKAIATAVGTAILTWLGIRGLK